MKIDEETYYFYDFIFVNEGTLHPLPLQINLRRRIGCVIEPIAAINWQCDCTLSTGIHCSACSLFSRIMIIVYMKHYA